jgi:hypothetical protein
MSKKEKFEEPIGKPFEFPTALLHQISECAPEGFLLFFIDNTGAPQVRANFNHQITEMGLRSYATKFLEGINTIEDSSITKTLKEEETGEEDSEE